MFSTSSSLPMSTSATSSAFVSTIANHTSSAAATQAATKITDNLSVLTTKELLGEQLANRHNQCSNQTSQAPNHNPPCSRPATLGGNNAPKVPEKGHSQHCKKHNNTQGNAKTGVTLTHNHNGNQVKMTPEMLQRKEGQMFKQYANSLKQSNQNNHPCTHGSNSNNNNTPSKVTNHLGTLREPHQGTGSPSLCPNSIQLPTSVNNVSVGTSTVCTEPDCDGNHDNDSFDDNCSEKSSSTSNSTSQKDGKYCDCCYCEFFGHGNPPVAPTSKNYAEMRDKLRLRLKKKVEQTETKSEDPPVALKCSGLFPQGKPVPVVQPPISISPPSQSEDPLETKGLDELIKFINGTEEDDKKPLSAKAAKRARQKQRKAEEKMRQEAEQLRKEHERERRLKLEEEKRRQAEEAERKKNEAMSKKQRKQAAKRAKSSSNSPTPAPANSAASSCDKSSASNVDQLNKNAKRKGKHKDDLPTLQVNITCEIEHGSETVTVSSSNQKSVNNNNNNILASQNPLKTTVSSRPSTEGGHVISTPPSIDNRIIINSKQNKNKEPQRTIHKGSGDASLVTINSEHIAQITRQQQELLKKQTQQLIQLKLQQEAKKQLQLVQQQQQQQQCQQQQQQQQQPSVPNDKGKKVNIKIMQSEKPSQGQITPPTVNKSYSDKPQAQPVKNNVKITVKTSTNSTPTISPRVIEQNNNQRASSTTKTIQRINEENSYINLTPLQSSQNRKAKKIAEPVPSDVQKLQQQYHVQGLVSARPATSPSNHLLQQNGTSSSPVKGQVRQPPAGQAQNCDVKTPSMDRKQDQGKKQEDSPPSDQGKSSGGKTKKVKRKNKGSGDINFIDEVFMPKSESDIEGGDMDEYEREIEEFKRFCADSSAPVKREKLQVNVNIKDIFAKKKTGLCN